jgi:SAM-dependent methyltransferase
VLSHQERVLELGASLGRLLKHYHNLGYQICGLERNEPAVRRLRRDDPELDIIQGDVQSLPYEDNEFGVVLAFSLYHNLEDRLHQALSETARCLKAKGRF